MPSDPEADKKRGREKLAVLLKNASEELLAEGDADGARIVVDALKELRELEAHDPASPPKQRA